MSMSKKHFIELADVMRETFPKPLGDNPTRDEQLEAITRLLQWVRMRDEIASFCQRQNPAFKRDRWIAYINGECGPNGGPVKGGIHKGRHREL